MISSLRTIQRWSLSCFCSYRSSLSVGCFFTTKSFIGKVPSTTEYQAARTFSTVEKYLGSFCTDSNGGLVDVESAPLSGSVVCRG